MIFQHEFAQLRAQLSVLMDRDPHGSDFGYTVRSLYFDSVHDRDLYATLDGELCKSKIRLRIYDRDGPVKLELKQKEGSDSLKRSLLLSREEAQAMQQCEYGFLGVRPEEAARACYMQLMQGAYQPKTLMEYEREAYVFPAGDVRVTFDTGVRATASAWDLFARDVPWTPVIPAGTGVLEVKYTSFLPSFLKQAVQTDRLISANSKYVQAREFYQ